MNKRKRIVTMVMIFTIVFSACGTVSFAGSKEKYFGKTPGGKSIYYTVKNVKAHTIRKYAAKPSKADWNKYCKGLLDLSMVFANQSVAIPYSVACVAIGLMPKSNTYIRYGTRFFIDAQMHSIKQRTFYIYDNKKKTNKRVVYTDQYGTADLLYYIDPVGKNVTITLLKKKSKRNVTLKTRCFSSKSYIKKRCGINYNHRSKEVWSLDNEVIFQKYK